MKVTIVFLSVLFSVEAWADPPSVNSWTTLNASNYRLENRYERAQKQGHSVERASHGDPPAPGAFAPARDGFAKFGEVGWGKATRRGPAGARDPGAAGIAR